MIKTIEVPSSNTIRQLNVNAKSYMKFSNNITAINVVSTLQENEVNRAYLTKFNAGSNIKAVLPSCFISCSNLSSVSFAGDVQTIGDYAFYGCTSLNSVNILSTGQIAGNIGECAFARSGVQTVKFGSKMNSSEYAYLGQKIFASCYSLKDITFKDTNLMTDAMLQDCSSLTSVSFARSTQVLAERAFERCTSLKSIKLPADVWRVPDGFASKCTSLSSFQFNEPGDLSYRQSLGNNILENTAVTSLTFPSSLTSFDAFSDNTLAGMDQLKEIHFNGMSYSSIVENGTIQSDGQKIEYVTDKIYYEEVLDPILDKPGIDKSLFIKKSQAQILDIMRYCYDNNVPMVVFESSSDTRETQNCVHCRNFATYVLPNQSFIDFVKNNMSCIIMYVYRAATVNCKFGNYNNFMELAGNNYVKGGLNGYHYEKGTFVIMMIAWRQKNGNVVQYAEQEIESLKRLPENFSHVNNIQAYTVVINTIIVPTIQTYTRGFTANASLTNTMLNSTLMGTGCFGLNHKVRIYSNDNQSIKFKPVGGENVILYSQNVQVDQITTNDFRYGQWYGKAKVLREYADSNYIPVLVIASQGDNYKESMIFNNEVFNDDEFQDAVMQRNILLCKVESLSFSGNDWQFVVSRWMNKGSFSHFPLVMMYWLRKDGSIEIPPQDSSQPMNTMDAMFNDYAYFSSSQTSGKIDDVQCVHNASELLKWIDSLTVYKSYASQPQFMKPAIKNHSTRYPKYKKYENQLNDDYGRYYPVAKLLPASQSSYEVNINNESGSKTVYTLTQTANAAQLPPEGTYQYFSMLRNEQNSAVYDSIYQISGLMFKIGSPVSQQIIRSDSYGYEVRYEDQYLASIGVDSTEISTSMSSFFNELYMNDVNDDPTTEIDSEFASTLPFLWNVQKTIQLKPGTSVDSKSANVIMMWLSSQAQLTTVSEIDDDGTMYEVKILVPSEPQSVISSQVIGTHLGTSQLLWIKEFNNS